MFNAGVPVAVAVVAEPVIGMVAVVVAVAPIQAIMLLLLCLALHILLLLVRVELLELQRRQMEEMEETPLQFLEEQQLPQMAGQGVKNGYLEAVPAALAVQLVLMRVEMEPAEQMVKVAAAVAALVVLVLEMLPLVLPGAH
ncbi:hypothetical protein SDC9_97454 [bioreactor metagenome]|uniref:Uncharacterized protein n=1 Tax=bioreactor metagenome TaxID=1076179 RepID=A0A645AEK1_9ZZZZ